MKFENIRVMNFENALRGMRNPLESWEKSDSIFGLEFEDCESILHRTNNQPYEILYSDNGYCEFVSIGPNDMQLMQKLIKGGGEHRKFMRQIFVSVDITAPLYFWKEFDTYKVGTTANSTSTMHKLASKPISTDCFEMDDFQDLDIEFETFDCLCSDLHLIKAEVADEVCRLIDFLECLRKSYLKYNERAKLESNEKTKARLIRVAKAYWKELVRWLPESWLQTRTVTMTYENLFNMIHQRENHKLNEWSGKDNPKLISFIKFVKTLPYTKEILFI